MITTIALMLAAVVAVANGESKLRSNTAAQVKVNTCKNTDLSADLTVLNRWCQTHNTLRNNQYCMYACPGGEKVKVTCRGSNGWEKTSKTDICPAEAAPSRWMSARTGRSYNEDGTRFQKWGAKAHNAENLVANLQCCSQDGSKADRKPFNGCNKDKSGHVWDGGMTWLTANGICKDAGQRLCTDAEVFSEIGGYTGCNFDNQYVWTSTPWAEVPEAARAGENYKTNGCPDGYTQSGGLGADKGGCGLESCGARYGAHAKNENECAKYCNGKSNCKSFSYAPNNGDKNHQGKKVCTIYSSTDFNQKWYGKKKGHLEYMQIACVKN